MIYRERGEVVVSPRNYMWYTESGFSRTNDESKEVDCGCVFVGVSCQTIGLLRMRFAQEKGVNQE